MHRRHALREAAVWMVEVECKTCHHPNKAEMLEMTQGSTLGSAGKGVFPINLRLAAGALLVGLRHSQFRHFGRVTGMDVFSSRTLEELAPRVWAAKLTPKRNEFWSSWSGRCFATAVHSMFPDCKFYNRHSLMSRCDRLLC